MGAAVSLSHLLVQDRYDDGEPTDAIVEPKAETKPAERRIREQVLTNESFVDVLRYLDRDHLDQLQGACRRFRELIDDHMQVVCLRPLRDASIMSSHNSSGVDHYYAQTERKVPFTQEESGESVKHKHEDLKNSAEWLANRLRSSVIVEELQFYDDVPLNWDLCKVFEKHGSRIRITGQLRINDANFTPEVLVHFISKVAAEIRTVRMQEYNYSICYRPAHISNELLKACAEKGVEHLFLPTTTPQFAENYALSDDGILDFCFRPGPTDADAKLRELTVGYVQLTPNFFRRLVQASRKSTLSIPLKLKIERLRPHNQNIDEFAEQRQQLTHCQLFDFKEESTRFQILIYQPDIHNDPQGSTLELIRGPAPADGSRFFY